MDNYIILKRLNSGSYGMTFLLCSKVDPDLLYTVKIFYPIDSNRYIYGTDEIHKCKVLTELNCEYFPTFVNFFSYNINDNYHIYNDIFKLLSLCDNLNFKRIFNTNIPIIGYIYHYIEGFDLFSYRNNIIDINDLTTKLLNLLTVLQCNKIAHLDLKPENIIYNPKNGKITCIDVGSMMFKDDFDKTINSVIGTDGYIPVLMVGQFGNGPKKINFNMFHFQDKFAVGIILYTIYHGKYPFTLISSRKYLSQTYVPPRTGCPALDKVISDLILNVNISINNIVYFWNKNKSKDKFYIKTLTWV